MNDIVKLTKSMLESDPNKRIDLPEIREILITIAFENGVLVETRPI